MKMSDLSLRWRHQQPQLGLSTVRLRTTARRPEDTAVRYRTAEVAAQTCKDRAVDGSVLLVHGQFLHDASLAGFEMHVHVSPTFMQRRSHVALDERPHFRETERRGSNGKRS